MLFWDGQLEDDARLVVAVARTAAAHGARILTRVGAVRATGDSARLRDELTGDELDVSARVVVNATGVWASELAGQHEDGSPVAPLRPSKGTHIVLRSSTFGEPGAAMMLAVPGERKFVFAVPHPDGLVIAGLTDDPVERIDDVPHASQVEIDYLLGALSHWLAKPVTRDDVVGSYAGLRPLVAAHQEDASKRTADLSRRHLVARSTSGVVTVVGGKLTTYRRMAEDTVNALGLPVGPCVTRSLPLLGAGTRTELAAVQAPARLVRRYGTEAAALADLITEDSELAEPLAPSVRVLGAEVVWALRAEGALTVDDILERRTRLSLVPEDAEAARAGVERLVARYGARWGSRQPQRRSRGRRGRGGDRLWIQQPATRRPEQQVGIIMRTGRQLAQIGQQHVLDEQQAGDGRPEDHRQPHALGLSRVTHPVVGGARQHPERRRMSCRSHLGLARALAAEQTARRAARPAVPPVRLPAPRR